MGGRFRPGYFSPDPKAEPASPRTRMDNAVLSRDTLRENPVSVAVTNQPPKDGAVPVSLRVPVDLKNMGFTQFEGRHFQQIVFLTALLDSSGAFISGKESIMDLALSDEKLASLRGSGLTALATLSAAEGTFQVRTVVRGRHEGQPCRGHHSARNSRPLALAVPWSRQPSPCNDVTF